MGDVERNAKDNLESANEAFNSNDFGKAVELYGQVLAVDPGNVDVLISRAHAHIKNDSFAEAKKDANQAVDLARAPGDASKRWAGSVYKAFLRSGVASFHMGNYAEAKNCFLEGLKHPQSEYGLNQWVIWCDEKLAKLKSKADSSADKQEPPKTDEKTQGDVKDQAPKVAAAAEEAKTMAAAEITAPPVAKNLESKVKYDFYQTDAQLVIEIRIKGLRADDVTVKFDACQLAVSVQNVNVALYNVNAYQLNLNLAHPVVPEKCSFKVMSTKIEVRLAKKDGIRWPKLEAGDGAAAAVAAAMPVAAAGAASAATAKPPSYPSKSGRNWDKIVVDIEEELKSEKPEGEAALNELFQNIYRDADEDTKRAMNKSFQESGGTVLSTNWNDIRKQKTEIKPPDGMEFKKWD